MRQHRYRPILVLLALVVVDSSSTLLSSSHSSALPTTGGSATLDAPPETSIRRLPRLIVVGSVNADTFLQVQRLPVEGENLTTLCEPQVDVPGGKGCTQAVAAAKLLHDERMPPPVVTFVGQFGSDNAARILLDALQEAHVDTSHCGVHTDLVSGRGYVIRSTTGSVSAVVSGGANQYGWHEWERTWNKYQSTDQDISILQTLLDPIFPGRPHECMDRTRRLDYAGPPNIAVLLQQEVPEYVNLMVATYCHSRRDCIVLHDVGGQDRNMSRELLQYCDYLLPNESELRRLVHSMTDTNGSSLMVADEPMEDDAVVMLARQLQARGARHVLVTRGRRGSTLVKCHSCDTPVLHQRALVVDDVVDETGAGDCFRAAFAVALLERRDDTIPDSALLECMAFASAAGACAVTRHGAVPSTPTRDQVQYMMSAETNVIHRLRGGGNPDDTFPFGIGSRLNSMKDRPELWSSPLTTPRDYVQRQATIDGLTCVDFNYPQHFLSWSSHDAKQALDQTGLVAGAVCLRYPSHFARGALHHPDASLRRQAIQLTLDAAQAARDLGCNEVVIWSAYDGYDYPFQVDYQTKWTELVESFQECCDAFPDILFSLEFKPTDENTRFFTVPSTGAALLMVQNVNRSNFGLTLDVGHMLMAGENPGQSIAMVGRTGKLFGVQLNDGYTRLAAEDGLMFGSIHPSMALEIMYQLRQCHFAGHLYLDTFPQRTDPVAEAEYNIRRIKAFWKAAGQLDDTKLRRIRDNHDAIGALEMVNEALRNMD